MNPSTIDLEQLKNDLLQKLRSGETTVRFTKVDGSERVMRCTLAEDKIPSEKQPKSEGSSTTESAVRAFDLDKGEWRSFRIGSLISY